MGYPPAAAYAANFIIELCGGDYTAGEELDLRLGYDPDPGPYVLRAVLEEIIEHRGLPLSTVVREDVERVCANLPPLAFADEREYAARYRAARGIVMPEGSGRMVSMAEMVTDLWQEIEEAAAEREQYGATLGLYRSGVACRTEQEAFYRSEEWALRAQAVRAMARHRCERCGSYADELHAHHLFPIYSAYSRLFARNFDACRMQALCRPCHDSYHRTRVKHAWGFEPATRAEKVAERERNRRMMALHDAKRECAWCKAFVWERSAAGSAAEGRPL